MLLNHTDGLNSIAIKCGKDALYPCLKVCVMSCWHELLSLKESLREA